MSRINLKKNWTLKFVPEASELIILFFFYLVCNKLRYRCVDCTSSPAASNLCLDLKMECFPFRAYDNICQGHFPEIIATCQFTLVILRHFVSNRNPKNWVLFLEYEQELTTGFSKKWLAREQL